MTDLPRTPLTALTYDGGSLNRPDHGALIDYADGRDIVTFHPACFDRDGAWRPEVLIALAEIIDVSAPLPTPAPYVPNLAEWRQSGRAVPDLGAWLGNDDLTGVRGRIYAACPESPEGTGAYIEGPTDYRFPTDIYHLTIGRDSWTGTLAELEPRLYEWWMAEHCDWRPAHAPDQRPYPPQRCTRAVWPFWRPTYRYSVPESEAPIIPQEGHP